MLQIIKKFVFIKIPKLKSIFILVIRVFKNRSFSSENGFSLIEIIIAMAVIGILSIAGMHAMELFYHYRCNQKTIQNKEIVILALSAYFYEYGLMPCAAKPMSKSSANFGLSTQGCYCGVVPFRTLGLSAEFVKDGYGNYLVYAVHPCATIQNGLYDSASFIDIVDIYGNKVFNQTQHNFVLFIIASFSFDILVHLAGDIIIDNEDKSIAKSMEKHNLQTIKYLYKGHVTHKVYNVLYDIRAKKVSVWWFSYRHFLKFAGLNRKISESNNVVLMQ